MQLELDPVSLGGWKSQQALLVGSEHGVLRWLGRLVVAEAGGASFHFPLLSQGYHGHRCFGLVRMVVPGEDGCRDVQPVHLSFQ